MNRKEKVILNSFIKEATRAIMKSPEAYSSSFQDKAGQVQKGLTDRNIAQNDRTGETDISVILEELAHAAGPNTYIRFENQYGKKSPEFSVSPIVTYDTPHGIYSYPFDKENFISLIEDKSPTDAEFATDYSHFHIFKGNMSKTEIMSKKGDEIQTKYKTSSTSKKDILEAFRSFSMLLKYNKKENKLIKSNEDKQSLIEKIISEIEASKKEHINFKYVSIIDHEFPSSIKEIIESNNFFIENNKGSIVSIFSDRRIINKFADLLHSVCHAVYSSEVYKRKQHKKVILFRSVKKAIEILSGILGKVNNTQRGQYYSLLLHVVGIDGIKDKGSGLVHANEPTQFVSHDFDGLNLKVIGTYRNIFKDIRSNDLYEKLINIASKPENKRVLDWVWNTSRAYKKNYNVGQGNVPEPELLKVIDAQKNISLILATTICKNLNATAKVHLAVLDKTNQNKFIADSPEAKGKLLDVIIDNSYVEDEVLRHILDNENPDYKHKEKIAKHKNASKETKDIAGSFRNTIKKYVDKSKDLIGLK